MDDLRCTETCACGASFDVLGFAGYVKELLREFRELHAEHMQVPAPSVTVTRDEVERSRPHFLDVALDRLDSGGSGG